LAEEPRWLVPTLADPTRVRPAQRAGAIHLHRNGRWLYVTNRANATRTEDGGPVFVGGENNIALFVLDVATGEPRLAGHFDTGGIEPRTFTIDSTGTFLVVANHSTLGVRTARGDAAAVPRSWVVYRIGDDGGLALVRRYDRRIADLFWIGAAPPGRP
jgi:hypothetical protein